MTIPDELMTIPDELLAQLPEPDANGLRIVNREAELTLPGDIIVWAEVRPLTQEEPEKGNSLIAIGILSLLQVGETLDPRLAFGSRITLLGDPMDYYWGLRKKGRREKWMQWTASTWMQSLRQTEEKLLEEVGKLWAALQTRQDAYHSEGIEYVVAAKLLAATTA